MKKIVLLLLLLPFCGSAQHHDFKSLSRWSSELRNQELFYLGGAPKMKGSFVVYSTGSGKIVMPVGPHYFYRRNHSLRKVSWYSSTGHRLCDSIFSRNGRLRTVLQYKESDQQ